MELEKQVCSVELAKKLEELGVAKKSFWTWNLAVAKISKEETWYLYPSFGFSNHKAPSGRTHHAMVEEYSAFTTAELGEMLPADCYSMKFDLAFGCWKHDDGLCEYAPSEADARAKMLIYLLENGLAKVEELS